MATNNGRPAGTIGIGLSLNGSQFLQSLDQINKQVKVAESQMKANLATMSRAERSYDDLATHANDLTDVLEMQSKKTQELERRRQELIDAGKEGSKEERNLAIQINNSIRNQERYNQQLRDTKKEMIYAQEGVNGMSDELKELQRTTNRSAQNLSRLGDEAGATEKRVQGLTRQTELAERAVRGQERVVQRLTQEFGENSREVLNANRSLQRMREQHEDLQVELQQSERRLEEFNEQANEGMDFASWGEKAKNFGTILSGVFIGATSAVGALAVEVVSQMETMETRMETMLDTTKTKAKDMLKAVQDAGKRGAETDQYQEGVIRAGQRGVKDAKEVKQMADQAESLNYASGGAYETKEIIDVMAMVRKRGGDINEQSKTVQKLMKAGIEDFDQAMEYLPQMLDGGMSIDQIVQGLKGGMESGAWNSDKSLDLLAEGQKRVVVNDKANKEIYDSVGLGAEFADYQAGKIDYTAFLKKANEQAKKLKGTPAKKEFWATVLGTQGEDIDLGSIDGIISGVNKTGEAYKGATQSAKELKANVDEDLPRRMAGAWNSLKQAIMPLGEELSKLIVNVIDKLEPKFEQLSIFLQEEFIPAFKEEVLPTLQQLSDKAVAVAGIVGTVLAPVLKSIWNWFTNLSDGSKQLVVGLGLVAMALPVLIPLIGLVLKPFRALVAIIKGAVNIFGKLKGTFSSGGQGAGKFGKTINTVKEAFRGLVTKGKDLVTFLRVSLAPVFNVIKNVARGLVTGGLNVLKRGFDLVKGAGSGLANVLRGALRGGFAIISNIVKVLVRILVGSFKGALTVVRIAMKALFVLMRAHPIGALIAIIITLVSAFITAYKNSDKFRAFIQKLWNKLKEFGAWVSAWAKKLWEGAKNLFSNLVTKIKNFVSDSIERFREMKRKITDFVTDIKDDFKKKFDNVVEFMKGIPKRIWDAILNQKSKMKDKMYEFGKSIGNGIEDGVNGAVRGINKLLHLVGVGSGDYDPLKKVDIKWLAKGTDYHEGGLAVVNDQKGGTYQELVTTPDGNSFIPEGRNVMMNLPKGSQVLPAKQTDELMNAKHYAWGTEWIKKAYDKSKDAVVSVGNKAKSFATGALGKVKEAGDLIANPEKLAKVAIEKMMNLTGSANTLYGQFAGGFPSFIAKHAKDFIKGKAEEKQAEEMDFGGGDFGNYKPFKGDFNKISNKMGVYDFLYDLGKQIVNKFKGQYPTLYISDGKRTSSKTKAGTTSDHVYGLGLDLARGGIKDQSYYKMAQSLANHPYLKYSIGSDMWNKDGGSKFTKFPYGGHMNHLHISGKNPSTAKKAGSQSGSFANVSGGAKAWTSHIKKAYKAIYGSDKNISTNGLNEVLEQIQTESGGNAKIRQQITDVNSKNGSGGAKGLLQFIQSTFNNYKMRGHGDIFNGYDQLLALFNIKEWYNAITRAGKGKGWSPRGGRVHAYEKGGLITKEHMAMVGEGNKPELIIPLTNKNRALQLLNRAYHYLGEDGFDATVSGGGGASREQLALMQAQLNKQDQMIELLMAIAMKETNFYADGKQINDIVQSNQTKVTNRLAQAKGF